MPFARILLRQGAALPVRNVGQQYLSVLRKDVRQFKTESTERPGVAMFDGSKKLVNKPRQGDNFSSFSSINRKYSSQSLSEVEVTSDEIVLAHRKELAILAQHLSLYNQNTINDVTNLKDMRPAMDLYQSLRDKNVFLSETGMASRVLQGLHNTLRVSARVYADSSKRRRALLKHQIYDFIKTSLEMILTDAISGRVILNYSGIMHALLSFSYMGNSWRGLELYEQMADPNSGNLQLREACERPIAVAIAITLMADTDAPIESMEALFNKCVEKGGSDLAALYEMMIKAYIQYDYISDALRLFSVMLQSIASSQNENRPVIEKNLVHVHDSFVACKNVDVALNFFFEGCRGETPYVVSTHFSSVRSLINNVWAAHEDIEELTLVWKTYVSTAAGYRTNAINSVTYAFLRNFFRHYEIMSDESYDALNDVISFFVSRHGYRLYFLNTILSFAGKWKSKKLLEYIMELQNKVETPDQDNSSLRTEEITVRVLLAYVQHVEVEMEFLQQLWDRLVSLPRPLEKYDFWALARACHNVPERVTFFVQEYEKFRTQPDASTEDIIDTVSFVVNPYNHLPNIAAALGVDLRDINIPENSFSHNRSAEARKISIELSQTLLSSNNSGNISDTVSKLREVVESSESRKEHLQDEKSEVTTDIGTDRSSDSVKTGKSIEEDIVEETVISEETVDEVVVDDTVISAKSVDKTVISGDSEEAVDKSVVHDTDKSSVLDEKTEKRIDEVVIDEVVISDAAVKSSPVAEDKPNTLESEEKPSPDVVKSYNSTDSNETSKTKGDS